MSLFRLKNDLKIHEAKIITCMFMVLLSAGQISANDDQCKATKTYMHTYNKDAIPYLYVHLIGVGCSLSDDCTQIIC